MNGRLEETEEEQQNNREKEKQEKRRKGINSMKMMKGNIMGAKGRQKGNKHKRGK